MNLLVGVPVIIALCLYFDPPEQPRKMSQEEPFEDKGLNNWCEDLWEADVNRLTPDVDYDLDLQGRTRFSFDGPDMAKDPLFSFVKKEALERPTYKSFIALLDNYETATGVAEKVTEKEVQENWRFINAVYNTKCMELCYRYLKFKNLISKNSEDFKQDFYDMWFKMYRRSRETRKYDSSGFEHVFVGETRGDKEVIGFHNWIQFYLQEKAGNVDYKGFMASDRNPHLLTVQFSWKGEVKPKGGIFIGVSPEFEVALYTVCYMLGKSSYKVTLGGEDVVIKCHQTAGKIGTCYPQLPRWERRK